MNDSEKHASEGARIRQANSDALVRLMREHRFTLPQRTWDKWRPCVPTKGVVVGVVDRDVVCVATDGVLGMFVDERGEWPVLDGHVQWFKWQTPIVTMVPYMKDGKRRFFKQVKDSGAPATLFGRAKIARTETTSATKPKSPRTPKPPSAAMAALLELE